MKYRYKQALVIIAVAFVSGTTKAEDTKDWYAFTPQYDTGPSLLAMEDWSPERAGAHGRVLQQGDKLMYAGREIKLWGLNVCFGSCAPEKETAEQRAAIIGAYGMGLNG